MAYTFDQLKHMTVAQLREIAKGVENQEAVQGYSQLNKEHLLPALCKALGIHVQHSVAGIDKAAIKTKMRQLKAERIKALDSHDHAALKQIRRHLHHLNRQIRAHMS